MIPRERFPQGLILRQKVRLVLIPVVQQAAVERVVPEALRDLTDVILVIVECRLLA